MLDDYAERAAARGVAAEATAVRTRSIAMREIFAHGASGGRYDCAGVERLVMEGRGEELDPEWLAKLARVCALQNIADSDEPFAIRALAAVQGQIPRDSRHRRFHQLEVELALRQGDLDLVRERLDENPDLVKLYHGYLLADTYNPQVRQDESVRSIWVDLLNRPLLAHGLSPIEVETGEGDEFDRISGATRLGPQEHGPLVTVVMTSFEPDRQAILLSARSILEQSWRNLELIVVDDGSGEAFHPVLDELEHLDERVRVVRMPINQGTYLARNEGISRAQGEYVTGQDADDWSHPGRIQTQLRAIHGHPEVPAVVTFGLRSDERMMRAHVGKNPFMECAASLMVRVSTARELGGYLPARKAADNEFRHRIAAYTSTPVTIIKEPLYFIRVLSTSLSRGDYRPGWVHPARGAFRHAYAYWHEHADREELCLREGHSPVVIPPRFQIDAPETARFDVIFAGDWKQLGGPQYSMLHEIEALRREGLRIGVMDLEAARFMSQSAKPLCQPVQRLLHQGAVTRVMPDDAAHASLVILRYPPILQFPSSEPWSITADRVIILANQAPSERDGRDIRYIPAEAECHLQKLTGHRGLWVPQGPTVRSALQGLLPETQLADFDMPGIIDHTAWAFDRSRFRNARPVIGRHSRDNEMKWPSDATSVEALYPTDGSADVRILGGASTPLDVLGLTRAPVDWLVFPTNDVPIRDFLCSIDFFVYYQHPDAYDAFGRAILEALAAGCVAILPERFRATFGDAALYAEASEVPRIITDLWNDREAFHAQATRAMTEVAERFSYANYASQVADLVSAASGEQRGG